MNVKLIGSGDKINLFKTICNNRGVEEGDILWTKESEELLENIDKGKELLFNSMRNNKKILIIVDEDNDGFTSSAMMLNFIRNDLNYNNVDFLIHTKTKAHGIILEELENISFDLLIVPDAGSNDKEEIANLYEKGKEVLVLDHHEIEYPMSKYGVIINNQLGNYKNKGLSGAGVVYKFIQYCANQTIADKYIDLASIGIIGDVMDTRYSENRNIINRGLKTIKNPFINEIINKKSYNIKSINITSIAFYVVPVINAVIRVGNIEEKTRLFKAMAFNEDIEDTVKMCINLKAKQDRNKEKAKKLLQEQIENNKADSNSIIITNTEQIDSEFRGLVAMSLCQEYRKPVLALKINKDNVLEGSGRNYEKSIIKNLKEEIEKIDNDFYVAGHQNAFGIKIHIDKINLLVDTLNRKFGTIALNCYDVDFIFDAFEINSSILTKLSSFKDYYGTGFKEPLICIENLDTSKRFYKNEKGTMCFFEVNGIRYTKFKLTKEDNLENSIVNIVGRVDSHNQIFIEDYKVLEKVESEVWF